MVLNDLDVGIEGSPSLYAAKYVDDMTLIETVPKNIEVTIEEDGNRPVHKFKPEASQNAFDLIRTRAEDTHLKINEQKTQILSVSSSSCNTTAQIETIPGEYVSSGKSLKMLGFLFSDKPTVNA